MIRLPNPDALSEMGPGDERVPVPSLGQVKQLWGKGYRPSQLLGQAKRHNATVREWEVVFRKLLMLDPGQTFFRLVRRAGVADPRKARATVAEQALNELLRRRVIRGTLYEGGRPPTFRINERPPRVPLPAQPLPEVQIGESWLIRHGGVVFAGVVRDLVPGAAMVELEDRELYLAPLEHFESRS